MITIFTALYPEAKELIRALSLKKDMTQNHFQVFSDENNQIQIVIMGAVPAGKIFLSALFRFVTN